MAKVNHLTTEARNPHSVHLDQMSPLEIARLMNDEDAGVAGAVQSQLPQIAQAMEWIAQAFRSGGRLLYLGAGTSGRLGVLDAAECPPTFSTPGSLVVGIIAGGNTALTHAIEGAEDNADQGALDLQAHQLSDRDVLVGIATSGRTPYVIGGLDYARQRGARSIGFSCNADSDLQQHADLVIAPVVGPEILSGSTRLKAGTATKLVLNMLTTGAMVLVGKTYGNLMVDLRATNIKLKLRSQRIVGELTGLDDDRAAKVLEECGGELKTAVVAALREVDAQQARQLLQAADGKLREALQSN
jgi:N-acetylmuramic acid 6-phosphate etherase